MDSEVALTRQARKWLSDGVLSAGSDSYVRYLTERGYSLSSVQNYLSCIAHFSHWLKKRRLVLHQIDEVLVCRFLDNHLSQCECGARVQRSRNQVRAALKHLLVVLRLNAEILPKTNATPESIQEEIRRFDCHLDQVCGLATNTRIRRTGIVRTFLMEQFGTALIDIAQVKPKDVHRFVLNHVKGCKPSTGKMLGVALCSYLRFRGMHGDCVQALMVNRPLNHASIGFYGKLTRFNRTVVRFIATSMT